MRNPHPLILLAAVLVLLALAHVVTYYPSEPYFNGDETRHVMTGVYVRDLLLDGGVAHLRNYTIQYYLQYPALGLLVWPPFFYAVLGLFMLVFGTSVLAAKVLVGLFASVACGYLFALVWRTHGPLAGALTTLLFGLTPLVFDYTSHVMLEAPTLACALAALFHFERYLDRQRRLDLVGCCLATALTALTRFDGLFLAPCFLILLVARRKLGLLLRWEVVAGVVGAVLLVAPFYLLTAMEFGGAHLKAVTEGTTGTEQGLLAPSNLIYYPLAVPGQIGWVATAAAGVGLVGAWQHRQKAWPYLALLLATYLTFTPLAELEPRHAIYWVPALAVFAIDGCFLLAALFPSPPSSGERGAIAVAIAAIVILGTTVTTLSQPTRYVRGYADAARYVVEHTHETDACLFDSYLNGNFIYQVRRHDPARRIRILRGDKLLYSVLSDPHAAYTEHVRTEQEILQVLSKYDPEYIIVEDPQPYFHMPLPDRLREILRDHPERFRLEKTIPLGTNDPTFRNVRLLIYRNLVRNPDPVRDLEIDMPGLGRSLRAGGQ